jgi:SanA protein
MTKLKPIVLLLLVMVMAAWVINQYMVVVTKARIFRLEGDIPPVEAVIVPGASVYRSGKLSPVLRQRMEAAVHFLASHPESKLVLSGFTIPNGYSETQAMVEFAHRKSVPAARILVDEKGRSTYVTLLNCRRKFPFRRILIVSQDFHLPRALYIAERLGMEASGLVAAEAPNTSGFYPREYAGRLKDFVLIRISKYFHAD